MRNAWRRLSVWLATAHSSFLIHKSAKWFWVSLTPVSYVMRSNIAWVTLMSHYAIVVGHWGGQEAGAAAMQAEDASQPCPHCGKMPGNGPG